MLLKAHERAIITNLLNSEGTIAEISLNLDIYSKIKFNETERNYLDGMAKDRSFSIENAEMDELEVEFTNSEKQRLISIMERLGEMEKMNIFILPIYFRLKS